MRLSGSLGSPKLCFPNISLIIQLLVILALCHNVFTAEPNLNDLSSGSYGRDNSTSVCVQPSGAWSVNTPDCTSGEVLLIGQYMQLGVNNVGSWGTESSVTSSYFNGQLGFLADYDRNGWSSSSPGFAGDFFIAGYSVEGWVLQYKGVSGKNTRLMNEGLMDYKDFTPTSLQITSSSSSSPSTSSSATNDSTSTSGAPQFLSVLWAGSYGEVEVRKITYFDSDALYFRTVVVLKNIGAFELTNVYYMRTIDPDQESRYYNVYDTQNYVQYQQSTPGYEYSSNKNMALVCAVGANNYNFFLGLGTINSNSKVSNFGFIISNPAQAYNDKTWQSYGGSDVQPTPQYASRMKLADESMHLVYQYSSIQPGEVVSLEYTHIVHVENIEAEILATDVIAIISPTDTVTGPDFTIVAAVKRDLKFISSESGDSMTTLIDCTFSVFARSRKLNKTSWYNLDSVFWAEDESDTASSSNYTFCRAKFDSTLYDNGPVHLRVVANVDNGTIVQGFVENMPVILSNPLSNGSRDGSVLCFNESDKNGTYLFNADALLTLYLSSTFCLNDDESAVTSPVPAAGTSTVSYFAEYLAHGFEMQSKLLLSTPLSSLLAGGAFQSSLTLAISDLSLAEGVPLNIRAIVSFSECFSSTTENTLDDGVPNPAISSSCTSSAVFSGIIAPAFTAPSDIVLAIVPSTIYANYSNNFSLLVEVTSIDENTPIGTVVGMLASSGGGAVGYTPQYVYSLIDDVGGMFSLRRDVTDTITFLVISSVIDYETLHVAGCGVTTTSTTTSSSSGNSGNEAPASQAVSTACSVSLRVQSDTSLGENCCLQVDILLQIVNINEAPTAITPTELYCAENMPEGSLVGQLIVSADDNIEQKNNTGTTSYTYWIVPRMNSTNNFFLNSTTGELFTATVFDFESAASLPSYQITVRVIDHHRYDSRSEAAMVSSSTTGVGEGFIYADFNVTITLIDIPEAPVGIILFCTDDNNNDRAEQTSTEEAVNTKIKNGSESMRVSSDVENIVHVSTSGDTSRSSSTAQLSRNVVQQCGVTATLEAGTIIGSFVTEDPDYSTLSTTSHEYLLRNCSLDGYVDIPASTNNLLILTHALPRLNFDLTITCFVTSTDETGLYTSASIELIIRSTLATIKVTPPQYNTMLQEEYAMQSNLEQLVVCFSDYNRLAGMPAGTLNTALPTLPLTLFEESYSSFFGDNSTDVMLAAMNSSNRALEAAAATSNYMGNGGLWCGMNASIDDNSGLAFSMINASVQRPKTSSSALDFASVSGFFSVDSCSGAVMVAFRGMGTVMKMERPPLFFSFSLRAQSTSNSTLKVDVPVHIVMINSNEPPFFVGNISTAFGIPRLVDISAAIFINTVDPNGTGAALFADLSMAELKSQPPSDMISIHTSSSNILVHTRQYTVYVPENSAAGISIVHNFSTIDNDDGAPYANNYSYCCEKTFSVEVVRALTSGADSEEDMSEHPLLGQLFSFPNPRKSELILLSADLDFETVEGYQLTIRVTDEGGLYSECLLLVLVLDEPEAPVLSLIPSPNEEYFPSTTTAANRNSTADSGSDESVDFQLHYGSVPEHSVEGIIVTGGAIVVLQENTDELYELYISGGNSNNAFSLGNGTSISHKNEVGIVHNNDSNSTEVGQRELNQVYYYFVVNNMSALVFNISEPQLRVEVTACLINAPTLCDSVNYTVTISVVTTNSDSVLQIPKFAVTSVSFSVFENAPALQNVGEPVSDKLLVVSHTGASSSGTSRTDAVYYQLMECAQNGNTTTNMRGIVGSRSSSGNKSSSAADGWQHLFSIDAITGQVYVAAADALQYNSEQLAPTYEFCCVASNVAGQQSINEALIIQVDVLYSLTPLFFVDCYDVRGRYEEGRERESNNDDDDNDNNNDDDDDEADTNITAVVGLPAHACTRDLYVQESYFFGNVASAVGEILSVNTQALPFEVSGGCDCEANVTNRSFYVVDMASTEDLFSFSRIIDGGHTDIINSLLNSSFFDKIATETESLPRFSILYADSESTGTATTTTSGSLFYVTMLGELNFEIKHEYFLALVAIDNTPPEQCCAVIDGTVESSSSRGIGSSNVSSSSSSSPLVALYLTLHVVNVNDAPVMPTNSSCFVRETDIITVSNAAAVVPIVSTSTLKPTLTAYDDSTMAYVCAVAAEEEDSPATPGGWGVLSYEIVSITLLGFSNEDREQQLQQVLEIHVPLLLQFHALNNSNSSDDSTSGNDSFGYTTTSLPLFVLETFSNVGFLYISGETVSLIERNAVKYASNTEEQRNYNNDNNIGRDINIDYNASTSGFDEANDVLLALHGWLHGEVDPINNIVGKEGKNGSYSYNRSIPYASFLSIVVQVDCIDGGGLRSSIEDVTVNVIPQPQQVPTVEPSVTPSTRTPSFATTAPSEPPSMVPTVVINLNDDNINNGGYDDDEASNLWVNCTDCILLCPSIDALTFSVDENSAANVSIGYMTVQVFEPVRTAKNTTSGRSTYELVSVSMSTQFWFHYKIIGGNTPSASPLSSGLSSPFAINPTTGLITVNTVHGLDFEDMEQYELVITATQEGTSTPLTSACVVHIEVTDINEPGTLNGALVYVAETSLVLSEGQQTAAAFPSLLQSIDNTPVPPLTVSDPDYYDNVNGIFAIECITCVSSCLQLRDKLCNMDGEYRDDDDVNGKENGELDSSADDLISKKRAAAISVTTVTFGLNCSSPTPMYKSSSGGGSYYTNIPSILLALCDPIAVNSTTGVLLLKAGAALNYELMPSYVYEISWESRGVVLNTTNLTVSVVDVPEAPIAEGFSLTLVESDYPAAAAFSFFPNSPATAGMIVAQINATDPDFEGVIDFARGLSCVDHCGLKYVIIGGNSGSTFTLDQNTGALSVNRKIGLDFEKYDYFELLVRITDKFGYGLGAQVVIYVYVLDAPDCSILFLDAIATNAAAYINNNSDLNSGSYGSNRLLSLSTAGGDSILVTGRNFGLSSLRSRTSSPARVVTTINARMHSPTNYMVGEYERVQGESATQVQFVLLNCSMHNIAMYDNTKFMCYVPPGAGSFQQFSAEIVSRYYDRNTSAYKQENSTLSWVSSCNTTLSTVHAVVAEKALSTITATTTNIVSSSQIETELISYAAPVIYNVQYARSMHTMCCGKSLKTAAGESTYYEKLCPYEFIVFNGANFPPPVSSVSSINTSNSNIRNIEYGESSSFVEFLTPIATYFNGITFDRVNCSVSTVSVLGASNATLNDDTGNITSVDLSDGRNTTTSSKSNSNSNSTSVIYCPLAGMTSIGGAAVSWQISVGNQVSNWLRNASSYAPPTIGNVSFIFPSPFTKSNTGSSYSSVNNDDGAATSTTTETKNTPQFFVATFTINGSDFGADINNVVVLVENFAASMSSRTSSVSIASCYYAVVHLFLYCNATIPIAERGEINEEGSVDAGNASSPVAVSVSVSMQNSAWFYTTQSTQSLALRYHDTEQHVIAANHSVHSSLIPELVSVTIVESSATIEALITAATAVAANVSTTATPAASTNGGFSLLLKGINLGGDRAIVFVADSTFDEKYHYIGSGIGIGDQNGSSSFTGSMASKDSNNNHATNISSMPSTASAVSGIALNFSKSLYDPVVMHQKVLAPYNELQQTSTIWLSSRMLHAYCTVQSQMRSQQGDYILCRAPVGMGGRISVHVLVPQRQEQDNDDDDDGGGGKDVFNNGEESLPYFYTHLSNALAYTPPVVHSYELLVTPPTPSTLLVKVAKAMSASTAKFAPSASIDTTEGVGIKASVKSANLPFASKSLAILNGAGGEILRLFGTDFGPLSTPTMLYVTPISSPSTSSSSSSRSSAVVYNENTNESITFREELCTSALWMPGSSTTTTVSTTKASAVSRRSYPYVDCTTAASRVGWHNLSLDTAWQSSTSLPSFSSTSLFFDQEGNNRSMWYSECKVGFFGAVGRFCSPCSSPGPVHVSNKQEQSRISLLSLQVLSLTAQQATGIGLNCPLDGMYFPISAPGWFIKQESVMEYDTTSLGVLNPRCVVSLNPSLVDKARSDSVRNSTCSVAWPCYPAEACTGGSFYNGGERTSSSAISGAHSKTVPIGSTLESSSRTVQSQRSSRYREKDKADSDSNSKSDLSSIEINSCADGYQGDRCAQCVPGSTVWVYNECQSCESVTHTVHIALLCLSLLLVAALTLSAMSMFRKSVITSLNANAIVSTTTPKPPPASSDRTAATGDDHYSSHNAESACSPFFLNGDLAYRKTNLHSSEEEAVLPMGAGALLSLGHVAVGTGAVHSAGGTGSGTVSFQDRHIRRNSEHEAYRISSEKGRRSRRGSSSCCMANCNSRDLFDEEYKISDGIELNAIDDSHGHLLLSIHRKQNKSEFPPYDIAVAAETVQVGRDKSPTLSSCPPPPSPHVLAETASEPITNLVQPSSSASSASLSSVCSPRTVVWSHVFFILDFVQTLGLLVAVQGLDSALSASTTSSTTTTESGSGSGSGTSIMRLIEMMSVYNLAPNIFLFSSCEVDSSKVLNSSDHTANGPSFGTLEQFLIILSWPLLVLVFLSALIFLAALGPGALRHVKSGIVALCTTCLRFLYMVKRCITLRGNREESERRQLFDKRGLARLENHPDNERNIFITNTMEGASSIKNPLSALQAQQHDSCGLLPDSHSKFDAGVLLLHPSTADNTISMTAAAAPSASYYNHYNDHPAAGSPNHCDDCQQQEEKLDLDFVAKVTATAAAVCSARSPLLLPPLLLQLSSAIWTILVLISFTLLIFTALQVQYCVSIVDYLNSDYQANFGSMYQQQHLDNAETSEASSSSSSSSSFYSYYVFGLELVDANKCYVDGGNQSRLSVMSVVAIIAYGLCFPLLLCVLYTRRAHWSLWKSKSKSSESEKASSLQLCKSLMMCCTVGVYSVLQAISVQYSPRTTISSTIPGTSTSSDTCDSSCTNSRLSANNNSKSRSSSSSSSYSGIKMSGVSVLRCWWAVTMYRKALIATLIVALGRSNTEISSSINAENAGAAFVLYCVILVLSAELALVSAVRPYRAAHVFKTVTAADSFSCSIFTELNTTAKAVICCQIAFVASLAATVNNSSCDYSDQNATDTSSSEQHFYSMFAWICFVAGLLALILSMMVHCWAHYCEQTNALKQLHKVASCNCDSDSRRIKHTTGQHRKSRVEILKSTAASFVSQVIAKGRMLIFPSKTTTGMQSEDNIGSESNDGAISHSGKHLPLSALLRCNNSSDEGEDGEQHHEISVQSNNTAGCYYYDSEDVDNVILTAAIDSTGATASFSKQQTEATTVTEELNEIERGGDVGSATDDNYSSSRRWKKKNSPTKDGDKIAAQSALRDPIVYCYSSASSDECGNTASCHRAAGRRGLSHMLLYQTSSARVRNLPLSRQQHTPRVYNNKSYETVVREDEGIAACANGTTLRNSSSRSASFSSSSLRLQQRRRRRSSVSAKMEEIYSSTLDASDSELSTGGELDGRGRRSRTTVTTDAGCHPHQLAAEIDTDHLQNSTSKTNRGLPSCSISAPSTAAAPVTITSPLTRSPAVSLSSFSILGGLHSVMKELISSSEPHKSLLSHNKFKSKKSKSSSLACGGDEGDDSSQSHSLQRILDAHGQDDSYEDGEQNEGSSLQQSRSKFWRMLRATPEASKKIDEKEISGVRMRRFDVNQLPVSLVNQENPILKVKAFAAEQQQQQLAGGDTGGDGSG